MVAVALFTGRSWTMLRLLVTKASRPRLVVCSKRSEVRQRQSDLSLGLRVLLVYLIQSFLSFCVYIDGIGLREAGIERRWVDSFRTLGRWVGTYVYVRHGLMALNKSINVFIIAQFLPKAIESHPISTNSLQLLEVSFTTQWCTDHFTRSTLR